MIKEVFARHLILINKLNFPIVFMFPVLARVGRTIISCQSLIEIPDKRCVLFPLPLCSLWYVLWFVLTFGHIMDQRSYLFVFIRLHLIISINTPIWKRWACKMLISYFSQSVCLKSRYHRSYLLYITCGYVFKTMSFLFWWLWEYLYLILSPSSNRKRESVAIV